MMSSGELRKILAVFKEYQLLTRELDRQSTFVNRWESTFCTPTTRSFTLDKRAIKDKNFLSDSGNTEGKI